MKIDCVDEKVKEIILNEMFISEYKEVMRLELQGMTHEQIAEAVGYSKRQIERIARVCWREVCIRLAQKSIK